MSKINIYILICLYFSDQIQTTTNATKLLNTKISSLTAVDVPLNSQELNLTCDAHRKLTTTMYRLNFTCSVYIGGETASSIHELKPADISVVAALGDSLSVGLFAKNSKLDICLVYALPEYRGVSWSIGGDFDLESVVTLPNILRQYNPKLKGYSTGIGSHRDENSQLNMAVSGAITADLPFQAAGLVDKLRGDGNIDIDNDWKLVTIFIGGNDLCRGCIEVERFSALRFYHHLRTTLDILSLLPRVFINIAQVPNVHELTYLNTDYCSMMHTLLKVIGQCPCMYSSDKTLRRKYTNMLQELEKEYQDIGRDDFTVVIQPFFEEIRLEEQEDLPSYFSGDCFHFSQKTHALNALLLWNNMLQPVGEKHNYLNNDTGVICPSEEQYFYTFRNSKTKDKSGASKITVAAIIIVFIIVAGAISMFVLLFRGRWVKYHNLY